MMQPFPNPNYFNTYNQTSYPLYQSNQFQPQRVPQIAGKCVSNFNEITANDVPMDGNSAVFVKSDMSEVQIRAWNANGQITTTSYKPILDVQNANVDTLSSDNVNAQNNALNDVIGVFNERFDKLEKMLKPKTTKKEVVDE